MTSIIPIKRNGERAEPFLTSTEIGNSVDVLGLALYVLGKSEVCALPNKLFGSSVLS